MRRSWRRCRCRCGQGPGGKLRRFDLRLSTVPMTRLIPDWEIRVTNFGLGYILMCLVVAIAATNTGNNGLYLVLAAMLAAWSVSGMLSRRNVRGVRCEIETVGEVVATRPALLRLQARERASRGHGAGALLPPRVPARARSGSTPEAGREARGGRRGDLPAAGRLPRGGRGAPLAFPDRSVPQVPQGDPRERDRRLSAARSPPRSRTCRPRTRGAAGPIRTRAGGGSDIRTLREFVARRRSRATSTGNSPRACAAGSCASGRRSGTASLFLAWTTRCEDPADPAALERFEGAISRCAGQALMLLSRGAEVGFQSRGVKVAAALRARQRVPDPRRAGAPGARAARDAPATSRRMRRGDQRWFVS